MALSIRSRRSVVVWITISWLLKQAGAELPKSESALRRNLGQPLAAVRRTYPDLAYAGYDEWLGNYWICNASLGVYTRKGMVRAVLIRVPNLAIQGVAVGDSIDRAEVKLGEAETMRFAACSGLGEQRTRPTLLGYPDRHLQILCGRNKVVGILLTNE